MRVVSALFVVALVLAGCGDDGGAQQVAIQSAQLQRDGKTLILALDAPCNAEQVQVTTEEAADEVQVTVEVTGGDANADCGATSNQVQLTQRVGDRTLIDTSNDEEVEVTRAGA